jgi:DNA-binding SARP family transcriptional activator/tetratricopeptide (TPR) repeat protein
MRWRILGPVEVAGPNGRVSRLLRPQHRAVLAYLLLNANLAVSTDQLVDAVWAGVPPASARTRVHACISQIRNAIRDAGADDRVLTSQASGYRLEVVAAELDLTEFADLVARGRTAAAAAEPVPATELLREALGLWRGTALAGAAGAFVEAAAAALQEQQLAAVEALMAVELTMGHHAPSVAKLSQLVAAHPLRERLVGQLMVGLAGSGRQAEALSVYADLRTRLNDQLGVEPGPEISAAHVRILRQELPAPTMVGEDRQLPVPPSPPTATPAQLPTDIPTFIGRGEQLHRLDALLSEQNDQQAKAVVISAIAGSAGIGKTALAVHWAHRVTDRFPGGQLYTNLRGFDPAGPALTPADVLRGFLDALGVSPQRIPETLEALVGLYRSLLADRRVLVVLDNARDAEQVRPLLPGAPGCLALVTSRNQLQGLVVAQGAHHLALDLLSIDEAREFMDRRLGADRVAAEPDMVDDIIAGCARLPLALSIAAARAMTNRDFPLATLAKELSDSRGQLDAFASTDTATDVRAVFSWSYHNLTPDAARLFRRLGLHPGPDLTAPVAASIAGIPIQRVRLLLTELTHAHLLSEHTPGRYKFHDLLHAYAAELVQSHDSDTARHDAIHRMLDYYLHTAHAGALLLYPQRDPIAVTAAQRGVTTTRLIDYEQAMAWFSAERAALLASIGLAANTGFDTHTSQLAWMLVEFFDLRGLWHDYAATQHAALAAVRRQAAPLGQAHTHRNLGRVYFQWGRYHKARTHYQQSLDLFTELGAQIGQGHAQRGLAVLFQRQGQLAKALDHAKLSVDMFQASEHQTGLAMALNAVGWMHAQSGNGSEGLTYCEQALQIQQQIGDLHGEADTLDSLGYIHLRLGQQQQATACYEHAVRLRRKVGHRLGLALTLRNLGDCYHATSNLDASRAAWSSALSIFDELNHADAHPLRVKLGRLPTRPSCRE